jgi:hypothetical protein
LRILRRILIGLAVTGMLIIVFVYWLFPIGISIWTMRTAPKRARVVPTELKDFSASQEIGSKFDYFGYEFELPWTDIDTTRQSSPNHVVITFLSGLQVSATAVPAKELVNTVATSWFRMSPGDFQSQLGYEATRSDYEFLKRLYAFTPRNMNLWAFSPSVHYRDSTFLRIKYMVLLPWAADSGIFYVGNQDYSGFQQGSPQARPVGIIVDLYADSGGVEVIFNQEKYRDSSGVTQREINRLIQSLHRVPNSAVPTR